MNEPLFGSVSQPWAAAPFPLTGRPPSSMLPPATGLAAWSAIPAIGTAPVGATLPSFAGPEVAVGVPVPVFLATVALRRGQPLGPSNDQEIEDFIYDALELLPGSGEVDVRCEGGRVTFTGAVHYRRLKRDVGEIAWAIPNVNDVHNTVTITARRRSRGVMQSEPQTAVGRKSA
jgi:hypothetical protein